MNRWLNNFAIMAGLSFQNCSNDENPAVLAGV